MTRDMCKTVPVATGRTPHGVVSRKRRTRKGPVGLQPTYSAEVTYWRILHQATEEYLSGETAERAVRALAKNDADALIALADELVGQLYPTAAEHRAAHQFAALVRKYPFSEGFWHTAQDPEGAALKSFTKAEQRCRRYNRYFALQNQYGERFAREKHFMRGWIRYVLGDSPVLPSIYQKCGFGPGASIGLGGDSTSFADKALADEHTCSPGAFPYVAASLSPYHNFGMAEMLTAEPGSDYQLPFDTYVKGSCMEAWLVQTVTWVSHNKVTFVPKTAKTHRAIAVEPLWNSWIQKGIDEEMRLRLRRVGIDLRDQTRNQALAHQGSMEWCSDNPYCTIDLTSASDTIAREVVKSLLPPDWYDLLQSTRSTHYVIGDQAPVRYEKFVSMGNGFCFPLETLLFAAVVQAAYASLNLTPDYAVYGDDIIVRRQVFDQVLGLLKHFGFVPNAKKTFSNGPFRESCGGDYFAGKAVRPVYLDEKLETLEQLMQAHNALTTIFSDRSFLEYLRNCALPSHRLTRPYPGQANTAFEVELDEFMSSPFAIYNRATWSWSWRELQITAAPSDIERQGKARYNYALYLAALRGASSDVPFARRRKTRVRVVRRNRPQ